MSLFSSLGLIMHISTILIRTEKLFKHWNKARKKTSLDSIQNNRNVYNKPNQFFPVAKHSAFWHGLTGWWHFCVCSGTGHHSLSFRDQRDLLGWHPCENGAALFGCWLFSLLADPSNTSCCTISSATAWEWPGFSKSLSVALEWKTQCIHCYQQ